MHARYPKPLSACATLEDTEAVLKPPSSSVVAATIHTHPCMQPACTLCTLSCIWAQTAHLAARHALLQLIKQQVLEL